MAIGYDNEKNLSQWVANGNTEHTISIHEALGSVPRSLQGASFGPQNDGRLRSMGRAVCARLSHTSVRHAFNHILATHRLAFDIRHLAPS